MNTRDKLTAAKTTLRRVWALTTPFFSSSEKWKARGLLAAIVLLNLAAVYMLVLMNEWNRLFYDALEKRDQAVFWAQLLRFTYLAFGYIVIAVYKFYLTQLLEMRWRAWMTGITCSAGCRARRSTGWNWRVIRVPATCPTTPISASRRT